MSLRLGVGGMVRRGEDDVVAARHQFLLTVQRVAPEVFARLAEEALPLYETLPCRRPPRCIAEVVASPALEPDRSKAKAVCEAFKAAVGAWARAHNLDAPWMRDAAVWLLRWWHEFPHWRGQVKSWLLPNLVFMVPETPDPPEYSPATMTRDDYLTLVHGYMAEVEAAYRKGGWEEAPVKRNLEAFEWLARYQVKGESLRRIAGHEDGKPTVQKAIRQVAELIGLTLRAPLPGKRGPNRPITRRLRLK